MLTENTCSFAIECVCVNDETTEKKTPIFKKNQKIKRKKKQKTKKKKGKIERKIVRIKKIIIIINKEAAYVVKSNESKLKSKIIFSIFHTHQLTLFFFFVAVRASF